MNIYDEHPFKVILDYGHNPAAVEAMCQLVERLDVTGRRLCVVAVPGDRRDEDIVEIGRIAAGRFERYICRRDDNLRGRGPTRCPSSCATPWWRMGSADRVEVIPSEEAAVDAALSWLGRRSSADLRGCHNAELEADHPVQLDTAMQHAERRPTPRRAPGGADGAGG